MCFVKARVCVCVCVHACVCMIACVCNVTCQSCLFRFLWFESLSSSFSAWDVSAWMCLYLNFVQWTKLYFYVRGSHFINISLSLLLRRKGGRGSNPHPITKSENPKIKLNQSENRQSCFFVWTQKKGGRGRGRGWGRQRMKNKITATTNMQAHTRKTKTSSLCLFLYFVNAI